MATVSRARVQRWAVPLVFLGPALAVYACFVVVPVLSSLQLSVLEWRNPNLPPSFAGLGNFRKLMQDPVFWRASLHNAGLLVLSLAVQLPLAAFLAILLQYPTRCRGLFRTLFFAPMIMPSVAIAVLWTYIYLPEQGILDRIIGLVRPGFAMGWLSDPATVMFCVFVTVCWRYTGFHMVLFMAGLSGIPEELYEAARLDGAGEVAVTRHITLPLLRPVLGVSATLSVIGSLKYFDLVYMMAAGAPQESRELLATYMYRLAFAGGQGRYGYASAAAVVLFAAALGMVAVLNWRRGAAGGGG